MTRIGIYGYGNLGRGVEAAINQNDDMELVAVFTRRNPDELVIKNRTAKVCNVKDMADWKDKIDVMILCGGSATDLPEQTPECAKYFNVIDSFDTHARIPEHCECGRKRKSKRTYRNYLRWLGPGHVLTEPPVRKCIASGGK